LEVGCDVVTVGISDGTFEATTVGVGPLVIMFEEVLMIVGECVGFTDVNPSLGTCDEITKPDGIVDGINVGFPVVGFPVLASIGPPLG